MRLSWRRGLGGRPQKKPEEGCGLLIPIADAGAHGVVGFLGAHARAIGEHLLAENLSEAFDEIVLGGALGNGTKWKRGWLRFPPIPQPRVDSPLQRQRVHDQVRLAWWGKDFRPSRKC